MVASYCYLGVEFCINTYGVLYCVSAHIINTKFPTQLLFHSNVSQMLRNTKNIHNTDKHCDIATYI